MVSASILGAALGSGLALLIAMSIVIYKYYVLRRNGKEWAQLELISHKKSKAAICIPTQQQNFNILKERCQVQPKRLEVQGPSSPPLVPILASSQELPQRRASTCSIHFPRLLSVDEGCSGGSPPRTPPTTTTTTTSSTNERRGSGLFRCMSPIIRAISPEGSPSVVSDGSPVRSLDFRPPLTPSRSLSVEVSPICCSCSSPEPRSPLRATSPDLRSTSPSPELRPLSPRSRPISPLFLQKTPPIFDCTAANLSSGAISPIGTIQPDLYKKKDTILMDSQGTSGTAQHLGRLHFRLKYDFQRSDLIVHIIEAHDLTSSERGGFNDPYVKVALVPAVDNKNRQTKIQRKASNPYFNEIFKFPIALDDLAEKHLFLQVFDFDKFSRNDVVGEIQLQMRDVDVTSDVEVWSEIRKNKKPPGEAPELLFSLSYLPSAERLTVVVLKAQNLTRSSAETLNPFVKMYLLQDGRRLKKKKTSIRRNSLNPVWNEAIAFNVPSSLLSHTSLELKLFNNDQLLGTCVVGAKEPNMGEIHWNDMMQNTRKSVAMWHAIK